MNVRVTVSVHADETIGVGTMFGAPVGFPLLPVAIPPGAWANLSSHDAESGLQSPMKEPFTKRPFGLRFVILGLLFFSFALPMVAQGALNPVPLINNPLVPAGAIPGGPAFTLTVNGTGFVSGATVNWNGTARTTAFVSSSQLTAAIPASDIVTPTTASVTVMNPGPGGGRSNVAFFEVTIPVGGPMLFAAMQQTAVGPGPLVVADFAGRGKLDIAVVQADASLDILLGNGDGTFQQPVSYGKFSASSMVAGDFNNDGNLDLVLVGGSELEIFLGKGDGSFSAPMTFRMALAAGSSPSAMVTGDFDGDGNLDVAMANAPASGQGSVLILLGKGDGTFETGSAFASGADPESLAVGDFNRDGKLDIAYQDFNNTICMLLGNGDGNFGSGQCLSGSLLPPRSSGVEIATADVNGDGKLDLIQTTSGGISTGISIWLGNGDGTFQSPTSYPASAPDYPGNLGGISIADFEGGGQLDIAVLIFPEDRLGGEGLVLIGSFNFTQSTAFFQDFRTYEPGTDSLAAYDFNGDGRMDLIAGSAAASGGVILLQGYFPAVNVFPGSFDFGQREIGTNFPQTFQLTNSGTAALTLSGISFSGPNPGDFAQTNNCIGSTLQPAATCAINVTFTPTAVGNRSAMMSIGSNAPGSPQTYSLTGTASVAMLGLGVASGSSSSASITPGSTASYLLSIGGQGLSGTASLACSGVPTGAICSVPATVSVSGTMPSTFGVTVSTTSGTAAIQPDQFHSAPWSWYTATIIAFLSLFKRRQVRGGTPGYLVLSLILVLCSCGGGNVASKPATPATPPGNYQLTVTAQLGSTSQSVNLTLTVP